MRSGDWVKKALHHHGLGRRDIVPNVNFFCNVPVVNDGELAKRTFAPVPGGGSHPGDHLELRAEMRTNTPEVAPTASVTPSRFLPRYRHPVISSRTNTSTTKAIPLAINSLSAVSNNQVPTGMHAAAAKPIGATTRHSINGRTEGNNCAVTTNSIRTIIATVWSGPNKIANIGAMSIPEPTPT